MKRGWWILAAVLAALPVLLLALLWARGRGAVPEEAPIPVPSSPVPAGPEVWVELMASLELEEPRGYAEQDELYALGALSRPEGDPWQHEPDVIELMEGFRARSRWARSLEPEARLRELVAAVAWGLRIKDAEGTTLSFRAGLTIADEALDQVEIFVMEEPEQAERARQMLLALPARRTGPAAIARECEVVVELLRDEEALFEQDWMQLHTGLIMQPWLYHPYSSVAWVREDCRAVLEQAGLAAGSRGPLSLPLRFQDAGWERWVHNPAGRVLADMWTHSALLELVTLEETLLAKLESARGG